MSLAASIILSALDALESDAELAARVRRVLGTATPVDRPEPVSDGGLVNKTVAARRLGKSISTLDRLVAEGAPYRMVGARRMFDVTELVAWCSARGRKPTTPAKKNEDTIDVDGVLHGAGLRVAGTAR